MNQLGITRHADRLERLVVRRLAPYRDTLLRASIDLLRISVGLVFILFGMLKFVPGLSPAEELATQTMSRLTFGLMPDGLSLVVVAALETTIGLCLLTGRHLRLGLVLLGMAMVGVLSPLVLFTGQLFAGPYYAPTLEAQYVIKDVILLAAGVVITVSTLVRHPSAAPDAGSASGRRHDMARLRPVDPQAGDARKPAPARVAA